METGFFEMEMTLNNGRLVFVEVWQDCDDSGPISTFDCQAADGLPLSFAEEKAIKVAYHNECVRIDAIKLAA